MKQKKSLMRDKKGQANTVMAIVIGGITVLLAVIIFANIFSVVPKAGPSVTNETWAVSAGSASTKTLANANLIDKPDTVKVYNATYTAIKDTDYTVDYPAGKVANITTGSKLMAGDYGVDYKYEETNLVAAKTSIRTIFYSSIGLLIIGFLVLAAVFILAVVQRLKGSGGGE